LSQEKYIYEMNQGRDKEGEERLSKNEKYDHLCTECLYHEGLLQYKPKPIDPEQIKRFDKTINSYFKHCPDENATFKDARAFIKWANEEKRRYEIRWFIYKTKNNPAKVIYVDSNRSKSSSSSNLK